MSTHAPVSAHQRLVATTRRPLFVFHWYGWRRFWRDFAVMQVGFVLVALWFSILRQVGVDDLIPWGIVEHGVADKLSINVGLAYIIVNIAAVVLALLVRETYGWGSVAAFVLITVLWADLMEAIVPDLHTDSLAAQLGWVVLAVPIGCLGVAIYMSVNAGAGPRDNLMLWLARVLHTNVGVARVVLEVGLIGVGLLLGGAAGWVTLTHVAVAGPAIWLAFRLLKIEPRNELWGRASSE